MMTVTIQEPTRFSMLWMKSANEFDLSKPIWLDVNINEFKRHSKARFYQDSFVDSIDFDFLEIQVIEE